MATLLRRSFFIIFSIVILIACQSLTSVIAKSNKDYADPLQVLNLLAYGGVGQLKYKMGGEPGGEAVDLDDSDWDITFPGFKWSQPNTNVWFRTTVTIPEKIGGFSLIGRKMTLYLYIDNGGDVFVNGDSLGSFEWGTAEFVISENLQPGDKYVIAVRGINRPGWGKVSEFRVEFSGLVDFQKRLQDKVWGLMIARKAAVKLSKNPEHWLQEIDKVAKRVLHSQAFMDGDQEGFLAVFDREGKALQGLRKELEDNYHLYCAGYAHIDLAWMWPWIETVQVVRNTSGSVLNIMERFPEFKYSMGQAHAYQWMEEYEPKLFRKIQQKVKEGKWEIVGGQWVEADGNLPSGESFVRQSLYAKRYFRDKFGVDVKVCWIPDSFGFNWNLPQILARSGIEAFITVRVDIHDTRNFPHRLFWWQGPDGSRVMAYIPRDGYMHDLNGAQLVDFLAEEKKELNFGKELVLYGVGNHGGGPTIEMLERAMRAKTAPAFPEMNLVKSQTFFESFTASERSRMPTWDSELYLERFRGCYTSQAKTKKHNRRLQVLAKTAEKLATLAGLYGFDYPREKIFSVWRTLLFNQFHDILPGTSINAVYRDTEREYTKAEQLSQLIIRRAFERLSREIDTRGDGEALIVFNPLSWSRTSPVQLELNDLDMKRQWSILDDHGLVLPVQKIDASELGAKLLFIAKDIPPFGYKVYRLVRKNIPTSSGNLTFSRQKLENANLSVTIDRTLGLVTEIFDKNTNRQVLSEPRGNLLQVLYDDAEDAWNIRFSKPPVDLDRAREVSLVEVGPVRATIKVVQAFVGQDKREPTEGFPSSFFTQYISLYDGLPYLEVRNEVMWWEDHKVLKVAFPVNVHSKMARYEIPYGSIERPTGFETPFEKARYEVPAQRWADLSDGDYGVSLINDCKHGYDIKGNVMRLTLLRSSTFPDPLADRGYHDFRYAIYPHQGNFYQGQVVRKGFEFNEPLQVVRTDSHKGRLPQSHSFIRIEPDNVVLNALKKSEDRDAWIVRIYETAGKPASVHVKFDRKIESVLEVNLIEDELESIDCQREDFAFRIKPHEIRSFMVKLK